jgi:hypothetical protein
MKAGGYLRLEARAGVTDWAEWDLVREETGVCLRGVANGKMVSVVVRERVCVFSGLRLQLGYCKCMRYQSLVPRQ